MSQPAPNTDFRNKPLIVTLAISLGAHLFTALLIAYQSLSLDEAGLNEEVPESDIISVFLDDGESPGQVPGVSSSSRSPSPLKTVTKNKSNLQVGKSTAKQSPKAPERPAKAAASVATVSASTVARFGQLPEMEPEPSLFDSRAVIEELINDRRQEISVQSDKHSGDAEGHEHEHEHEHHLHVEQILPAHPGGLTRIHKSREALQWEAVKEYPKTVVDALHANYSVAMPEVQRKLRAFKKRQFERYFAEVHEGHIHPHFAEGYLETLDSLSSSHDLNDEGLRMFVEMEIAKDGNVTGVRVVHSSGNPLYDAGTVDAIYRSAPFPAPPRSILSYDDRVYVRWGFYRNERRCGLFNVEPFLLNKPPVNRALARTTRFEPD